MARQPRFLLGGQAHLVEQLGHNGASIVVSDDDRRLWVEILRDAAASNRVLLHAWALGDDRFRLLVTPPTAEALSRMMQTLGRRYVGSFNTRHGRSGTLWDGRYRACVVESGAWELAAMRYVETLPAAEALEVSAAGPASSRPHHLGARVDPALSDVPAYWALGNTPFDRHAAWRDRLDAGADKAERDTVEAALRSGRPLGGAAFVASLQVTASRPLAARPRGRPSKAVVRR
jgi:putative transposase